MTNRELTTKLVAKFPEINNAIFEQDGVVKIHGESGASINELPILDYYDYAIYDPKEVNHVNGVNRKLTEYIESLGYMIEWINPGCIGVYEA